jgi:capsule biosynthesis phosphatase
MNKEYYKKLIIVDFDDTLCLHPEDNKSNISEGKPNIDLIGKLNHLYSSGYNIEIHTARGHFSADSREEAEEKYRTIIEDWLHKYQVKYDKLNFNKPYGIIYIDDKAMRPDEFHLLEGY